MIPSMIVGKYAFIQGQNYATASWAHACPGQLKQVFMRIQYKKIIIFWQKVLQSDSSNQKYIRYYNTLSFEQDKFPH